MSNEQCVESCMDAIILDLHLLDNDPYLFHLRVRNLLEGLWEEAVNYGIDLGQMNGGLRHD